MRCSLIVRSHADLKKAWKRVLDDHEKPAAVAAFVKPLATEAELKDAAKHWRDDVYRNTKINEWVKAAKTKYLALAAGQIPKS